MKKITVSRWLKKINNSRILVFLILTVILFDTSNNLFTNSEEKFNVDDSIVDTRINVNQNILESSEVEFSPESCSDLAPFDKVTTLYDEAEPFFDDSYVHEIQLYFDNDDWYDELYYGHANDPDDPYFPVKFVYDDIELDPIGINFKGHSSFMSNSYKKSFRIDFNYYNQEINFFGLKKLNLNNGHMDPTMLREKIFWDFASNYVEVVRCTFTRVYVNGEYFGLFTAIEHIDDEFIESRYGSKENGNIYRAETAGTLSYLGESEDLYSTSYELKTNEDLNDYSGLINLTNILTNTPTEDLKGEIENILDVNDTLYNMALLNIFSSLDSYIGSAHNFYLYENNAGQFKHILWDSNEAFGRFTFGLDDGQDIQLIDPFWTPTSTPMGVAPTNEEISDQNSIELLQRPPPPDGEPPGNEFSNLGTGRPLLERLFEIESYNQTYARILATMIRDGFNQDYMSDRIQILADLIREDVYADPNRVYTNEQFELTLGEGYSNTNNIFGLESFIEVRSSYLDNILNSYAKKTDIQINELMSSNNGTLSDEEGDYDPWIEIYNVGPGNVNLTGIYLTNNIEIPNMWAFSNIVLEDGDFYVVWADGEVLDGNDHLSLILNSTQGDLYLFVENESGIYDLIDLISYTSLGINDSYGRIPDGIGKWEVMGEFPTPNIQNRGNSLLIKLPTSLFINEIMVENKYTIEDPDDKGDFPDWIELYNSGNELIDLSGIYLTDNSNDPTMWRFPEGQVIEANTFLLIWADSEPEQGNLHTNFKLSGKGEEIGLISNDGKTIIDIIQHSESIQDFSIGRIPDGSDNIDFMISTPTPGIKNSELEVIEVMMNQSSLLYIFLGGLFGLSISINYSHKKSQQKDNQQFFLNLPSMKSRNDQIMDNIQKNMGVA